MLYNIIFTTTSWNIINSTLQKNKLKYGEVKTLGSMQKNKDSNVGSLT